MYCPICSAKVNSSQKFCRSCGFGLEITAKSVAEQLPSQADESLLERKNKLERLGVAALSVFGIGVLGLLLYLVGYKLLVSQGNILAALGVLAAIVIIGCGLLSVILFAKANDLQEASGKRRLEQPDELVGRAGPDLLAAAKPGSISSITDRTTELLFTERENNAEKS
jgi:hypothetical protein